MYCSKCGSHEIVKESTNEAYPEFNKEWPPYQPDEATLRARAHHEDVLEFRAVADHMKKKMGWAWEKAKPLMSIILHDRDRFLFIKYGEDRGLDCSQPLSQKWEKHIEVTTWMLAQYKDNEDIAAAVVDFIAEND